MSQNTHDSVLEVPADAGGFPIHGRVDPRFRPVAEAFRQNFIDGEEVGAAVSVAVDGRQVVSLWGGYRNAGQSLAWTEDTVVCVFSSTKMLAGVVLMQLVDQGLVDLDAPVADYWPEFAQHGKAHVKVRWIMDHRAGVPILVEPLWKGAIYDNKAMVDALARAEPLWPPGEKAGYHSLTQGYLIGEIVRQVTGQSIREVAARRVTEPLGADVFIGLSAAQEDRCADFIGEMGGTHLDTTPASGLMAGFRAQMPDDETFNTPAWRHAKLASANGHASARGLERVISMLGCGGTLDGARILSKSAVGTMIAEQHYLDEIVGERKLHQALCLVRSSPPWFDWTPNPEAYGAQGFGGSVAMCDPACGMTFAYVCNKGHKVFGSGPRAARLKAAIYQALLR